MLQFFLIKRKPVYSMTLTVKVCVFIYIKQNRTKWYKNNCTLFYLNLHYNIKYGLIYVGLIIENPNVKMRRPVTDGQSITTIFSADIFYLLLMFCI